LSRNELLRCQPSEAPEWGIVILGIHIHLRKLVASRLLLGPARNINRAKSFRNTSSRKVPQISSAHAKQLVSTRSNRLSVVRNTLFWKSNAWNRNLHSKRLLYKRIKNTY
jgi:hypothetical protein